ncbi:MAG: diguanylate cyclase [Gammaproteobacteria bacterium]
MRLNKRQTQASEDLESTAQVPALRASRVLLVDDDEATLAALKNRMADAGYDVNTALDGASALSALNQEFTPIVVVARKMYAMDGLDLCRAIRGQAWPGCVYVTLLTAHDAEEDVLAGLDAGADDYLSKGATDAQIIVHLNTATRILSLEHSLQTALEERRQVTMTDLLTGAHNRRYFVRYLHAELKRCRRFGTELSLLVLDIDHFKRINDQHGHAIGDAFLKRITERIQRCLPRPYDWLARLGGEEFVVVLPHTDLAGAAVVAERVRKSIEETSMRKLSGGHSNSITVSVGVSGLQAMTSRLSTTVDLLLADADRQLHLSKEQGRNRVTLADPVAVL